jgi:hypothetical protein
MLEISGSQTKTAKELKTAQAPDLKPAISGLVSLFTLHMQLLITGCVGI